MLPLVVLFAQANIEQVRQQLDDAIRSSTGEAAAPAAAIHANVACAVGFRRSQFGEDLALLPTLLAATRGQPGSFVEIGAFDGITGSNTIVLERCFGWHGLLVEANPVSFALLRKNARPLAHKVHSAVCAAASASEPQFVEVAGRGVFSGMANGSATVEAYLLRHSKRAAAHGGHDERAPPPTVRVPCTRLDSLMGGRVGLGMGGDSTVTFLSLDVEGAEELVLSTVDPARFRVVLVELDGMNRSKDAAVVSRLRRAGLRHAAELGQIHANMVFVRPDVDVKQPLKIQGTKKQCTDLGRYSVGCGGTRCCWVK